LYLLYSVLKKKSQKCWWDPSVQHILHIEILL
jgi:hypothetical protein